MDTNTLTAYVDTIDEVTRLVLDANIIDPEMMSEISHSWTNNLKEFLTDTSSLNETPSEDDTESSDSTSIKEEKVNNVMMCLYEKITKVKTKWKCYFKRGYINVNNRDYAFSTAYGDLEW